jgi:hypothetical protein
VLSILAAVFTVCKKKNSLRNENISQAFCTCSSTTIAHLHRRRAEIETSHHGEHRPSWDQSLFHTAEPNRQFPMEAFISRVEIRYSLQFVRSRPRFYTYRAQCLLQLAGDLRHLEATITCKSSHDDSMMSPWHGQPDHGDI